MKRILGLDLGIASIGWAIIDEAENEKENSAIIKTGVRIIPLGDNLKVVDKNTGKISDSRNPIEEFAAGKGLSPNAGRTQKRGMRRNLQRFKLRRKAIIEILKQIGFITDESPLAETNSNSTFSTYKARSKAPSEKISKEEFARVLLMINKKRGYKSSRKANIEEEGQLIDGMGVAKTLYRKKLTPGQYSYLLLKEDKKVLPDFYRSDLQDEFEKIWNFQKEYYPEILTNSNLEELKGKNKKVTSDYFEKTLGIVRAENKGAEKKLQHYEWRNKSLSEKIDISEIAFILTEINNQINQSSGYLGAISDRSKELYFNDLTVGQYLYKQLEEKSYTSLKNQVFYRKDYIDEFDAIWEEQSKHYPELTDEVREELRDITIFYQRRLKSQKGLINICEFEGVERVVNIDGENKKKLIGPRVAPKSSLVFQEFKIWQNINAIRITKKNSDLEVYELDEDTKNLLFEELNWVDKMTDNQFLNWLFKDSEKKPKDCKLNFKHLEGNRTNTALLDAYRKILANEGYPLDFKNFSPSEMILNIKDCFKAIGIQSEILDFGTSLPGNSFVKQPSYELWHLLYSYEDDNSVTGTEALLNKLVEKFGFNKTHAKLLAGITFQKDYGSLSVRAMRKILPYLREGALYDEACSKAGYNHSSSVTTAENENRQLKSKLEILKKK